MAIMAPSTIFYHLSTCCHCSQVHSSWIMISLIIIPSLPNFFCSLPSMPPKRSQSFQYRPRWNWGSKAKMKPTPLLLKPCSLTSLYLTFPPWPMILKALIVTWIELLLSLPLALKKTYLPGSFLPTSDQLGLLLDIPVIVHTLLGESTSTWRLLSELYSGSIRESREMCFIKS